MYFEFVKDVIAAVPSFKPQIEVISNHILSGAFYKALKDIRKLIAREEELLR
jgi:flagellar protein FlbT